MNLLFIAIPFISHAASTTTIRLYPVLDGFNQLYDTEGITSWPVARSYTGSLAHDPLISDIQIAHRADRQSGFYRIYRSSTIFDTSIIPDNAKIESATMFVYKGFSNNNGQNLVLTTHTHASTTTLTKSDWYLSNYGSELARGALSTSSYASFVFNATGTSYINTSGYTDIGGMQDNDFDDIDIGGAQSGVTFYSSDASGTSTDPYLEITYSVEPTTTRIYPTDDGFLQLYDTENQTNWSSARSYTGTFANGPFDINDQVAHRADKFGTGGKYRISRSTALFDTSVIPNNAVIASSTMYLYRGYSNNEGTHDLVLQSILELHPQQ